MEEEDEFPSKISRTPGKFRFRVLGGKELKLRSGLIMMNAVEFEEIEWLWEPYVPLGRLTMLGGDPGAGKSFITTALASALSRGESLPGEDEGIREPMNVLLLNAEDDPGDTLKPRLRNLQADQTRIAVSTEDIILDEDGLQAISEMIEQTGAKLVVIDPIVAFLGPKVDMNRANEVRHIMKSLGRLAKKKKIAIVVVRHNRKQPAGAAGGKAIYAGNGSIDFTAAVRSELAVTESKNGNKFLNHIKANSGMRGASIQYDILPLADGSGLFRWGSIVPEVSAATGLTRTFKDENAVKVWIHDMLKDFPDGRPMKEIIELGKLAGYSQTKLEHVKKGIALSAKRGDGWYWTLNKSAPVDHDADGVVED